MALSKILEEIKKLEPILAEDVSTGPIETLNGRRGRQKRAIETMKVLQREYERDLRSTVVYILVSGAAKEEFTKIATDQFECFSANPTDFYTDIARRIPPSLYMGREGLANLFDIVGRHLEDKAGDMDITGYPQLIFKQHYRRTIKSKEDFLSLLQESFNEQIGAEIVGIQALKSISPIAMQREHAKKVTPILLTTDDVGLMSDLVRDLPRLTNRIFVVAAGKTAKAVKEMDGSLYLKTVNEESVLDTLTEIKNQIKL